MDKRIRVICGCGFENHRLEDWIVHFQWRKASNHSIFHCIKLFLLTRIEWN